VDESQPYVDSQVEALEKLTLFCLLLYRIAMQISEDLVSEFKDTWEHFMYEMSRGSVINDTHLHLLKKLDAIMNQDYKTLYNLERIEHIWTKNAQKGPVINTGYGYFTESSIHDTDIYPAEMNNTYRPSSPFDSELRVRSAFHKPEATRINLEGSF